MLDMFYTKLLPWINPLVLPFLSFLMSKFVIFWRNILQDRCSDCLDTNISCKLSLLGKDELYVLYLLTIFLNEHWAPRYTMI